MLIAYALLIFTITSSVVAPSPPPPSLPQQAFGWPLQPYTWKALQGNSHLRLLEVHDPANSSWIYRWYRLKIFKPGLRPIWPDDADLDQVMQFTAIDSAVSRVTYFKLKRIEKNDQYELDLHGGYLEIGNGNVNDPNIPLEGYWGRAYELNTFPNGWAQRAITFDEVIKIQHFEGERQVQFIKYEEVTLKYYSALTVYDLTKGWQALQGNEDPRLLEVPDPNDPSVVYHWHRLKDVVHPEDKPTWARDRLLDDVMKFVPTNGRIETVSYLKLQRVETPDQHEIHLRDGYETRITNHLNDRYIPLVGFWGRANSAKGFNHRVPEGVAGPVVSFDKVIEIEQYSRMGFLIREVRFLNHEEMESHATFSPALTVYELTEGWQILEGNTDPRLREVPDPNDSSVTYHWHRLAAGVGKPTWPRDKDLDRVIQFIPTDRGVEKVVYLKLQRDKTRDRNKIYLRRTGYEVMRKGRVNDRSIPLAGFWGRAKGFKDLPPDTVGPVVDYDEVIEIKEYQSGTYREREIHFLEPNEKKSFYVAQTVYDVPPASSGKKRKQPHSA